MVEGVDLVEAKVVSVVVNLREVVAVIKTGVDAVIKEVEVVLKVVEEILRVVSITEDHGVGTIGGMTTKEASPTDLENHGVIMIEVVAVDLEGVKAILTKKDHLVVRRYKIKK